MAATSEVASLTMTQSFVGGPSVNGSPEGSEGGIGWTFRGMICMSLELNRHHDKDATYAGVHYRGMDERGEADVEHVCEQNRDGR